MDPDEQELSMSRTWDAQRRSIGALSIWVGTVGLFAPRALTALLGVRAAGVDAALPLLVRLLAARHVAMGTALLVTPPPQAARTTEVTLLLTVVDAAVVLVARRGGDVARRAPVLSWLVLATSAAGAVQWHRR